jgi:hypothetical protein
MKSLSTPVVLILFNRPEHVKQVFATIAEAKPKVLFIIADGPRTPDEEGKCLDARSVIQRVNWPCEVLTNIADRNLGCRKRIVSGLNWVFSLVEQAIILEDDCVPHHSFYNYCETLLNSYRHNDRVMEVSGCNYHKRRVGKGSSYFFSRYYHTLGWATWRRAWAYFDENIGTWAGLRQSPQWNALFDNAGENAYWTAVYDQILAGGLQSSWDYQWQFARWCNNGLAAVPAVNLVSNIGFGPEATNTTLWHDFRARLPVYDIGPIVHPSSITRDEDLDRYRFNRVELVKPSLFWKVGNKMKRIYEKFTVQYSQTA